MKKFLFIGLIFALVLILVGGAGLVVARARNMDVTPNASVTIRQKQVQPAQPFNYGPGGMMNGYGYGPGGMMGGGGRNFENGYGFMHDYMISAFAESVGLTVDQVNTRLSQGESLTQIANAEGFTGDKLTQLISQVWKSALDKAVAAGVITQSQADSMLQHMNNYMGPGFGPGFGGGNCPMWDNDKGRPSY
jgi:hypothetical protein